MTEAGAADYSELMWMLIYGNRFSDALGVYEEARGRRLENLQMHYSAAIAHWALGDLAAARRELENLSTSGDKYYQGLARLYLTELLIYQGDFREALRNLGSQPVNEPQAPGLEVAYLDALIPAQLELKQHASLATYYPKLRSLGRESGQPEILRDTGMLAIELGDLKLPRQLLSKMRKAGNGTDSAYARCAIDTLEGALALAEGQADAAIEMEQRAAIYPLSALPYFILGKTHEAKADWPAAAEAYERYLERKGIVFRDDYPGRWVLSHLYVARAHARVGRGDRARYYYDEFLKLWDQADSDLPTVREARTERQKLDSR
jgi:tetratricopeptide (TPR) repeat protein